MPSYLKPLSVLLCVLIGARPGDGSASPLHSNGGRMPKISTRLLQIGRSVLRIDIAQGALDLSQSDLIARVQRVANIVALYYGRFPVNTARILIVPVPNEHGALNGTTWGDWQGYDAVTRIMIGQHTTATELSADWIMTHEMTHMAVASLPEPDHWLEEGLATYVEPIARAQSGELSAEDVWAGMVQGMPNGEPQDNRGLDNTNAWGRIYWGGALFFLLADVEIHKQTHNRKGLQDALRAIVMSRQTINRASTALPVLKIADEATGTHVLEEMYRRWSGAPVRIDLDQLWGQLGVRHDQGRISFDQIAPLAAIRFTLTLRLGATALHSD